jgi:RimJ/RimL family protein N-acetyltransferase
MFAEILTERLLLRDLETTDAQRIFEYRSHPNVSRFQSWGTESPDAVQSYIRSLSATDPDTSGTWYQLGIILVASQELIGDCGFRVLENNPRQAEVGIALDPEFQGHGYGTEALRALLNYLFQIGKQRVYGSVDPRNLRSMGLLERVGMRKGAHLSRSLWFKGEWVDDVIFAVLASEFNASDSSAHGRLSGK